MQQHPLALPWRVTIDQRDSNGDPVAGGGQQGSLAYNDTTTALASSATFTGTARDIGGAVGTARPYGFFNAFALSNVAGTLRIECSNDNATWRRMTTDQAVAADTPVILTVPALTRHHRAVYVNGATGQTTFILNSSYSQA